MTSTQRNSYGSVWQQAVVDIANLLESDLPEGDRLRRVLELGYFSQFTSYPSPEFNEAVFVWLQQYLAHRYDFKINDLPDDLVELDIAPTATLIHRSNRQLSPDLLRYVGYAMQLRKIWPALGEAKANVLEIGAGYGGLARTLKSFHPGACFWLTDIPESLRCAEIYLRAAFPAATIAWQKVGAGGTAPEADFCLVPVADAPEVLAGRRFDLAINVWSFGEMPNAFIADWLKLIQQDCDVAWLFTINSFMAPVTPVSVARRDVGDWLFNLDERWAIDQFEIDPEIHRCPLIRNFPKGIGLLARRIGDEAEIRNLGETAAAEVMGVWREDWAAIAAKEKSAVTPGRPERMLDGQSICINADTISSRRLLALTDYVGHFNIDSGREGPFFRLWNDWRMNRDDRSATLLVAYLAMVGKSDLERRCTKEELLLLKRLQPMNLHHEYAAFGAVNLGRVEHDGFWLTDQEACDRALEHKKAGQFDAAEVLWTKVAAAYPAHGDCWFQLALLREMKGDIEWAAIFAAHAVHLGCPYYSEAADRMRADFLSTSSKRNNAIIISYFRGQPVRSLHDLADLEEAKGNSQAAMALNKAASRYPHEA